MQNSQVHLLFRSAFYFPVCKGKRFSLFDAFIYDVCNSFCKVLLCVMFIEINTNVESFDVIFLKILKSLFKQKFRGIVVIVSYFSL